MKLRIYVALMQIMVLAAGVVARKPRLDFIDGL